MNTHYLRWSSLCFLFAASPAMAEMQWLESGMSGKTYGNRPHTLSLSETAPAVVKRAPDGLRAPRYATLTLGPKAAPATVTIILDEVKGLPDRIYVDGNGNGDFTDDPALTIKSSPSFDPDSNPATMYATNAMVEIPFASGKKKGRIEIYQTRSETKDDESYRKAISYYADYGWFGEVDLGGKMVAAGLSDTGGAGDFHADANIMNTPMLWLNVGTGPKAEYGKSFLATKPFELAGKWWMLKDLSPDGHFSIVETTKPADAKPEKKFVKQSGPDLSAGKKAPAFTGKLLGGKPVDFPTDFKGKIVMLDFWATWCGPCIREIPNVLAAYNQYHDQGFEVLGISLDKADAETKLADFTKAKGMAWPQVFDGKFWDAAVCKQYGIHAVPYMILIDGDSGEVIEADIEGAKLSQIVEKALADKKK